jgi:hypothetical protein
LTQAGRTGARTVAILGSEDASVRREGEQDRSVALDELVATLTA